MNKKILARDFIIANLAAGLGCGFMFVGIVLQEIGILPQPPCAFLYYTHMYCPGCGGTRALKSLLKGHVVRSLCYNPAVVLGAILILYYEVTVLMTIFGKQGRIYYTRNMKPIIIYVIIVLAFFIIRNVLLVGFGIDILN